MDLGLAGKWALVCGASKGLGQGCAQALVREGVNGVVNARQAGPLHSSAIELIASGACWQGAEGQKDFKSQVLQVAADITTPEGRAAVFSVPGGPGRGFDIVVTNAGGPPPGDFRDWERADWIKAVDANMLTPIELIRATVDGMAERGFCCIVNITSSAVKALIDILGLSNGARSGRTLQEVRAEQQGGIPAGRFGTPLEFGAICAFLCSVHAGYITGQNILADGGAYPGVF